MRYKLDLSPKLDVSAPSASGVFFATQANGIRSTPFYAWLPSTWPPTPPKIDEEFVEKLKAIFEESILAEIKNVIDDASKSNVGLEHRGQPPSRFDRGG